MLFNRTVWVLIAALILGGIVFIFVIPEGGPDRSEKTGASFDVYSKEVSESWDKLSDRYDVPKPVEIDIFSLSLLGICGVGTIAGINFWLKRRNRDVIERFFSHFKDKR